MKWIKSKGSEPGARNLINVEAVQAFEQRITPAAAEGPRVATLVANIDDIEGKDRSRLYQSEDLPLVRDLFNNLVAFLESPGAVVFDVEQQAGAIVAART